MKVKNIPAVSSGFLMKPLPVAIVLSMSAFPAYSNELVEELVDSSSHTLSAFYDHFKQRPSDANYDQGRNHVFMVLETSAQAYIGDESLIDMEWLTVASSMDSSHHGIVDDFSRTNERSALLTPAVLRYLIEKDDYDLSFGLDRVEFGYAELHNSVDTYGRSNSIHPGHSLELGVWQSAFTYYVEDDIFSYVWMPVDSLSPKPLDANRWQGSGGDGYDPLPNGDEVDDLGDTPLGFQPRNWGHLAKYEATRTGYDYYVFGYYGPSPYSVIVAQNSLSEPYYKHRPKALQLGGGVAMILGSQKVYADAVAQHTLSAMDDSFLRATLGTQLKESNYVKDYGINEVLLTLEYAFDTNLRDQKDDTNLIYSSAQSRSGRDSLYTRFEVDHNDDWSYALAYAYNFADKDSTASIGVQYKHTDSLKYFGVFSTSEGDEGTTYGAASENDMYELGVEWSF